MCLLSNCFLVIQHRDVLIVHMQVHNAVNRTVEALENRLQLKPLQLPRGHILDAFLQFEALTDHSYSFHCILCGYYPPLLNLDVDKKGVFELSG